MQWRRARLQVHTVHEQWRSLRRVYDRRQSEAPATAWLALRQLVRQVIPVDRVYAARALKTQL